MAPSLDVGISIWEFHYIVAEELQVLVRAQRTPAGLLPVVDRCHGDRGRAACHRRRGPSRTERPIKKTSFSLLKFHQSVIGCDYRARSADGAGQGIWKISFPTRCD